jgi:hypothetical protein
MNAGIPKLSSFCTSDEAVNDYIGDVAILF